MKKNIAIRIVALAIAALMTLGTLVVLYLDARALDFEPGGIPIDGIDSARGDGMLIIYTPAYGERTNTNEWGYEVVVNSEHTVISVGSNNNIIPENGFVISGHNHTNDVSKKMKTFLEENFAVGDKASYNEGRMLLFKSDLPPEEQLFYTLDYDINGFNITRRENFLVIFTTGSRTGTNEYGYEIAVSGGYVVGCGGNNIAIPPDGFVVSGHGDAMDWLKKNIVVGMYVSYEAAENKVTFSYNSVSAVKNYGGRLELFKEKLELGKQTFAFYDYAEADRLLAGLESCYAELSALAEATETDGALLEFSVLSDKMDADFILAERALTESPTVEYRGTWIRPTQKTKAEVDSYVQQLYDRGINKVSVETLYNNTMILPMPSDSLFEQNPDFNGFDVLQAYIEACHERNIEFHIWMPIFYVGHEGSRNSNLSVGTKKPEWMSVTNKGTTISPEDTQKFQMLNPALREVREFLLETYKYILENYDIDGFELDYIRYWARSADVDFGYDKFTLDSFEAEYGVRPVYDAGASYWSDWVRFRTNFVTEMVKSVRELIDEVRPGVLLGADVGPNIDHAYNYIYQDYVKWLEEGYLDILKPMAYGLGFGGEIKKQADFCNPKDIYLAVGLSSTTNTLTIYDMAEQAEEAYSLKADGVVFFESGGYLAKNAADILQQSVFKNAAITPFLDKTAALRESLLYAVGRIENIILPLGGLSAEKAGQITALLVTAAENIGSGNTVEASYFDDVFAALDGIPANAAAAIRGDLDRAIKINNINTRIPDRSTVGAPRPIEASAADESSAAGQTDGSSEANKTDGGTVVFVFILLAALICAAVVFVIINNKRGGKKS